MKKIKWIAIALFLIVVIVMIFSTKTEENTHSYKDKILKHRSEQDKYMLNSPQSPLSPTQKKSFKGLKYFPIDSTYKVRAKVDYLDDEKVYIFETSDGLSNNNNDYKKYALLSFKINNKPCELIVYKSYGFSLDNHLFLPFTDLTTGKESYQTGRYIDIEISNESFIDLDFNLAYNPYCAVSSKYSCPLPPPENQLKVAIKAGEKF